MWKNLPAHTRASLLAALAGLVTLNGCSRAAPETKAPLPTAVSTANQPQTTLAEQPLADSLAFVAALALIQTTSALLPATAVSGGAPSMTTDTAPGSQPTLTAMPVAEMLTTAETEVWSQVILPPEPTAPATVVVNNYYVQQAPGPETEVAPAQPEQLIVVAGGGRFVPAARGNRGTTPPAPTVAAPTAPLSAGSMVATGSPLSTGSMVARGSGLTAPNTTTLLPPALPLQSPTTPPAQNPPRRGNRAGQ
jgi:hypothetical protein